MTVIKQHTDGEFYIYRRAKTTKTSMCVTGEMYRYFVSSKKGKHQCIKLRSISLPRELHDKKLRFKVEVVD